MKDDDKGLEQAWMDFQRSSPAFTNAICEDNGEANIRFIFDAGYQAGKSAGIETK